MLTFLQNVAFMLSPQVLFQANISSIQVLILAIALNEVLKYKTREKEKDELIDEETAELLNDVHKLDQIIDKQLCDIRQLENIVRTHNRVLSYPDLYN